MSRSFTYGIRDGPDTHVMSRRQWPSLYVRIIVGGFSLKRADYAQIVVPKRKLQTVTLNHGALCGTPMNIDCVVMSGIGLYADDMSHGNSRTSKMLGS